MASSRINRPGAGATMAGAARKTVGADEDMFYKAFDDTPKVQVSTAKELEAEFGRVMAIIANTNADWDKRVDAFKRFRSLFTCGIGQECADELCLAALKPLEISLQANMQDLRSQVVRETCITMAFLSCRLQQKFSRAAEALMPGLIKLLPNSAKIVSTSASVTIRFIIQSTHTPRLLPIIKYQLSSSKSKEIHKALCEIVERIVNSWPVPILERCLSDLQEVIRLGICDSDEQARIYARRAFNAFADLFKENAEQLYHSLDLQRQRMLNSENNLASMSNHGSTNSLNHGHAPSLPVSYGYVSSTGPSSLYAGQHHSLTASHHRVAVGASQAAAPTKSGAPASGSMENLHGFTSLLQRNKAARQAAGPSTTTTTTMVRPATAAGASPSNFGFNHNKVASSPYSNRSTSVIDVAAQRRAKARAYLGNLYHKPRPMATITSGSTGVHHAHLIAAPQAMPSGLSTPTSLITTTTNAQQPKQPSSNSNSPNESGIPTSGASRAAARAAVNSVISTPGVTVRSSRCRSQPGSRSTSPTGRTRRRSGIPIPTSRSTSPSTAGLSPPQNNAVAATTTNVLNSNHQYAPSPSLEDQLARLSLTDRWRSNSGTRQSPIVAGATAASAAMSSNNHHQSHHQTYHQASVVDLLKSIADSDINGNGNSNSNIAITIKYLTERIEQHTSGQVSDMLDNLMPPLIKAYDHAEAAVRKAAVFAMVAIFGKVGNEKMESHLKGLSSSKRKLLNVYIEKAQANNVMSTA